MRLKNKKEKASLVSDDLASVAALLDLLRSTARSTGLVVRGSVVMTWREVPVDLPVEYDDENEQYVVWTS